MEGDFGAEVDAALNARLAELRADADAARARIDQGVEAIRVAQPASIGFDDAPHPAAVSFGLVEDESDVPTDAEGIPLPEENL